MCVSIISFGGLSSRSRVGARLYADNVLSTTVLCDYLCDAVLPSRFTAELAQLIGEFWQRLEQVGYQTVIRHLEDGGLFILVDRHDDLGILHPGQMLDGPGYPHRDVKLRRDDLSGLPDLPIVRCIAGVDCGARGADRGP